MNTVLTFVKDLIFSSKIAATAAELGVAHVNVRSLGRFEEALTKDVVTVIFDLGVGDEVIAAAKIAVSREPQPRIVAFYPHVAEGLREQAEAAGISEIVARSKFALGLVGYIGHGEI